MPDILYDKFNKKIKLNYVIKIICKNSCLKFNVFQDKRVHLLILQNKALKSESVVNSSLYRAYNPVCNN